MTARFSGGNHRRGEGVVRSRPTIDARGLVTPRRDRDQPKSAGALCATDRASRFKGPRPAESAEQDQLGAGAASHEHGAPIRSQLLDPVERATIDQGHGIARRRSDPQHVAKATGVIRMGE